MKMKLNGVYTQIVLSMLLAAGGVALLLGELERSTRVVELNKRLSEQAELAVSLLSGAMIEDIIVEDVPVLETAMRQAINRYPQMVSIRLINDQGRPIASASSAEERAEHELVDFNSDIVFEGENFGQMQVAWSTREGAQLIEQQVRHARLNTLLIVSSLSALFLLLAHLFALRPLRKTHARMSGVLSGQFVQKQSMPWFVGRELKALDASVEVLQANLRSRDAREKELEKARNAADDANRSKSEFLANMSHEIRTPMNGIIGMADLLQNTELDTDQKLYSDTILSSAASLLSIINDILDFSKAEAGKFSLDPTPFNLRRTCEEVMSMLSVSAGMKGVEVVLRYHTDVPDGIFADSVRLRQILTNIAGNAVKFTSEGHVCVDVSTADRNGDLKLVFAITDTGIGIPEDQIQKIFRAFEQVDGSNTRKYEGTGLGLAISSHLVELMGGEIEVRSTFGKGTTFTVTLPLQPVQRPTEYMKVESRDLKNYKLLVVDDLPLNLHILREQLGNWHADVTLAQSGQEALEILQQSAEQGAGFDVIVLDYQMPEMTGIEMVQRLRTSGLHEETPVIVLSSADQSISADVRNALGIAAVLQKPLRMAALNQTIWSAIHPATAENPDQQAGGGFDESIPAFRVLVADDNKTNRLVVRSMLKGTPISTEFVENGRQAVDSYKECPPDVILMDMSMPVLSGIEATKEIRLWEQETEQTRCPIVALTANARKDDRTKCLSAGMDDFLTKPINKSALLDMCLMWVGDGESPV
ncbi:response regulator [Aliiroseovarius crassostreae]|nr:response regulator [Aliiroseovarius crassostreae]